MYFTNSKAILVKLLKLTMVVLACASVGCEPAPAPAPKEEASASDHDHDEGHEHPETLAAAVTELEGICAAIKTAYAKDDTEAAHGPLHDVGHLLEQFPVLIAKSSLEDAGKEEAKKAAETIFDSFGAVDEGLHGSVGKKYSEVSESIDASLKILVDKTKS